MGNNPQASTATTNVNSDCQVTRQDDKLTLSESCRCLLITHSQVGDQSNYGEGHLDQAENIDWGEQAVQGGELQDQADNITSDSQVAKPNGRSICMGSPHDS